jgi:DNA-binding transcriptional ArsR family regulator
MKVTVNDFSEEESGQLHVADVIRRVLSDGAKTPIELKEAVLSATNVSERVYYRHLKKLRKKNIVEEEAETSSSGDITRRYALKKEVMAPENFEVITQRGYRAHLFCFSKGLWELFAWTNYSPRGWSLDDEDVEEACVWIPQCIFKNVAFFPEVRRHNLDPDKYVFHWPRVFKEEFEIGNPLHRFFSLKRIYQAKLIGAINELELKDAAPFLGVKEFVDKDGINRQIAVVVRRRSDGKLQVCHVEFNPHFSKKWTDELSKEHDVSGLQIIRFNDEVLMRRAVFHLDDVLEDRRLLIPSKYSVLLKDLRLFNFSYTPPPKPRDSEEELMLKEYMETGGNFVHALAAAVSCADGLESNQSKMMWLKTRLKIW